MASSTPKQLNYFAHLLFSAPETCAFAEYAGSSYRGFVNFSSSGPCIPQPRSYINDYVMVENYCRNTRGDQDYVFCDGHGTPCNIPTCCKFISNHKKC